MQSALRQETSEVFEAFLECITLRQLVASVEICSSVVLPQLCLCLAKCLPALVGHGHGHGLENRGKGGQGSTFRCKSSLSSTAQLQGALMTGFFYSGLLASSVGKECASRNTHRAGWQLCSFAALQLCSHHETQASFTSAWEDLLRRAIRVSLLPWFKPYFQMLPHHTSHIDGRRGSASISTAGLISSTLTPDASLSPTLTYHTELQLTDAGVSKRAQDHRICQEAC